MLTKTLIENTLLIVGESFWLFSAAAQLHHAMSKKTTRGLSAITTTLNAAANVGWMTYFTLRHLWLPVGTNLAMLLVGTTLLSFILSHNRRQFHQGLLTILLVGPLTAYMLWRFPDASGWIGMVYNFIAGTPYLIKVIKTKRLSGVSGRALVFAWGAMTTILTYAILVDAPPLIAGCIQGMIYQVIITKYYLRYRRH